MTDACDNNFTTAAESYEKALPDDLLPLIGLRNVISGFYLLF